MVVKQVVDSQKEPRYTEQGQELVTQKVKRIKCLVN